MYFSVMLNVNVTLKVAHLLPFFLPKHYHKQSVSNYNHQLLQILETPLRLTGFV